MMLQNCKTLNKDVKFYKKKYAFQPILICIYMHRRRRRFVYNMHDFLPRMSYCFIITIALAKL